MAYSLRDDQDTFDYVVCPDCGERHETDSVRTLNIEEDAQGRDVLTYTCPVTGNATKSNIFRG